MIDAQAHRGPDDRGAWWAHPSPNLAVALGSRRLAIRDLSSAGHMPMLTSNGSHAITYNGEIYNAGSLRKELEGYGYRFRSTSDTEVVLNLYAHLGPRSVARLNGIFAFAIWDTREQSLFLARDHFGVKPLYYWKECNKFAFASEMKSLLCLEEVSREVDPCAFSQYLSFLWVPDPVTMFKQVHKLAGGHWALWKNGALNVQEYWDLDVPEAGHTFPQTEKELAGELRERIHSTVRAQLVSDVPIGAFLSAGVDSTTVVSVAASVCNSELRTFTVCNDDRINRRTAYRGDDSGVARRTAKRYGCQHAEITLESNVVDLLPKLIWHMDEPVADPAILSCYLINREASKSVKVILAGNGGDELFAGYRKYRAHALAQWYQCIPRRLRTEVLEPIVARMPSFRDTGFARWAHFTKKMARSGSLEPRSRFIQDCTYLSEEHKRQLCVEGVELCEADPRSRHLAAFEKVSHADFLNQMLYVDCKVFLVSLNLNYNDKMSMANSVEARVPFLDWELAQWVMKNVPPQLKMRRGMPKYILRSSVQHVVPNEIFRQHKSGFGAPVDCWLADEMAEMVSDLLSERRVRERGYFKPEAVSTMLREHRSGVCDWSMQLWQLLTFELWQQAFVDDRPRPIRRLNNSQLAV